MRKSYLVVTLIVGLMVIVLALEGWSQTSISYGQCVQGSIGVVGEIDIYSFEGTSGEIVILRLATDWRYYARLRLFFGGNQILQRDGEYGLRVDTLRLTASGIYTIWVFDDNGFETGSYSLCVQRVINPTGSTLLSYGQTVRDTVRQRAQMKTYTFSAVSNEPVIIRIASSWRYYPQIELYNSEGRRVRSAFGEYGLRLDTLNLPSGTYSLFVIDDNGHETGDYDLHLQRTTNPVGARTISYGQTLTDTVVRRTQIKPYSMTTTGNEIIILRLSGSWRYYPQIEIFNATGSRIRLLNGEYGLRVDTLRLTGGTYSLFVLDDNGHESGYYSLHLQRTVNPVPSRPLGENQPLRDTIRAWAETKAYTFCRTVQDCRVTIRMQADWRYYPKFELYGPDGRRLASAFGEYFAELDAFRLPVAGSYSILAMDDNGFEGGGYTLTIISTCPQDSCGPTAIDASATSTPTNPSLQQNYPNPFNPSTKINFNIPTSSFTTLKVFDILGKEVATLVNEELKPGSYETTFDGRDLSSGVYFYRLQAGSFVQTKKLLLVR